MKVVRSNCCHAAVRKTTATGRLYCSQCLKNIEQLATPLCAGSETADFDLIPLRSLKDQVYLNYHVVCRSCRNVIMLNGMTPTKGATMRTHHVPLRTWWTFRSAASLKPRLPTGSEVWLQGGRQ